MKSDLQPPFNAYLGDKPFLFVSYAHADKNKVYPIINNLYEEGVRIWYDEGIPAGSRWSDELAARIRDSAAFLLFVSEHSVVSNHCINEVSFVCDLDKPFVAVHLRETELPDGLKLMIGARQTIRRYDGSSAAYRQQLAHALLDKLTG